MRLYLFVLAFAVAAGPAYANTRAEHRNGFAPDTCGVSHDPHQPQGMLAVGLRCQRLLAAWRAAPDNQTLHNRCDEIARALSDRRCALIRA